MLSTHARRAADRAACILLLIDMHASTLPRGRAAKYCMRAIPPAPTPAVSPNPRVPASIARGGGGARGAVTLSPRALSASWIALICSSRDSAACALLDAPSLALHQAARSTAGYLKARSAATLAVSQANTLKFGYEEYRYLYVLMCVRDYMNVYVNVCVCVPVCVCVRACVCSRWLVQLHRHQIEW